MNEPPKTTSPLVQWPLDKILQYIVSYRDFIELEQEDSFLAEIVKQKDLLEVYTHVEYPEDSCKPRIWRKKVWLESYERSLKVKKAAEAERLEWNYKREKLVELEECLQEFHNYDEELARIYAEAVINLKDKEQLKQIMKEYDIEYENIRHNENKSS